MRLIDISVPVHNRLAVWEGDPAPEVLQSWSMASGDPANVTRLNIGAHTGTHVDAPRHFVANGASIDELPLESLVGPVVVREFNQPRDITAADLDAANIPAGTIRLICKTPNSKIWRDHPDGFYPGFIGIAEDGARWLAERAFALVGIDYLSVESLDSVNHGSQTHQVLLRASIIILEGLDLTGVEPGDYTLMCLPINLAGADGAPARAVLAQME